MWKAFLVSILLLLPSAVISKRTQGTFKLSGVNTEHVLASFAVGKNGGRVTIRIGSEEPYENEQAIKFHIYKEKDWPKFQKATLCTEKVRLAHKTFDLKFLMKGTGALAPKGGKWQAVKTVMLADPNTEPISKAEYFYFVIDDCTLEQYNHDNRVPKMTFDVNTWNYMVNANTKARRTTQFSASDDRLFEIHAVVATVGLIVAVWLFFNMTVRLARKKNNNTVHAAVLWVFASTALLAAASICELFHLEIYHYNGFGVYMLDALAAHMEAISDAATVLLLLSLAAGWTLPSDVVGVNTSASSLTGIVSGIVAPLSTGKLQKLNPAAIFGISVLAFHVILAQWGRMYNDDFDSYHDLNHLPGSILMTCRFILGFVFLGTTLQTRLHCKVHQLSKFYLILAVAGFVWFQTPPLVIFLCKWMLPLRAQQNAVTIGSALMQTSSMALLSWLVTSHSTTYHQYSHMSTSEKGQTLTESLASEQGTREWRLLGKAKIRLD